MHNFVLCVVEIVVGAGVGHPAHMISIRTDFKQISFGKITIQLLQATNFEKLTSKKQKKVSHPVAKERRSLELNNRIFLSSLLQSSRRIEHMSEFVERICSLLRANAERFGLRALNSSLTAYCCFGETLICFFRKQNSSTIKSLKKPSLLLFPIQRAFPSRTWGLRHLFFFVFLFFFFFFFFFFK
jgi:hypothetical protein